MLLQVAAPPGVMPDYSGEVSTFAAIKQMIHTALVLNIVIKVRWMPSLCHTKSGSATACGSTHEYGR